MTAPRTAKERVVAKWPDAHAFQWTTYWAIYPGDGGDDIGTGNTAADAWASAARKLDGKE